MSLLPTTFASTTNAKDKIINAIFISLQFRRYITPTNIRRLASILETPAILTDGGRKP